jgi:type II secretory pathway pseudopilin PulG
MTNPFITRARDRGKISRPCLQCGRQSADNVSMRRRLADEQGFGLIELVFAMLLLNVAILALVGAFQTSAVTIARAGSTSNGTVVADKVMEVYRDLRNCGIYLHGGTGNDASGWPDGIPNSTSAWYTAYGKDAKAYPGSAYFNNATPSLTPRWVTESTSGSGYTPIPTSSSACLPPNLASSTGIDPSKAVQLVTGPDGQNYTTLSYIVIVQPSGGGWTAGYVKQVTVDVLDPRNPGRVLARESSIFDPYAAP